MDSKENYFRILKYRKYDVIIMPQVIWIKTFYTSKRTSFFTFLIFLNALPDSTKVFKQLQYQFENYCYGTERI